MADYYFFCDQDDVWLPEKMEICLKKIKEAEKLFPKTPIISHCGLKVVDASLHLINESFHKMQKLYPEILCSFEGITVTNYIPGCSMCFNRPTKEIALPVSPFSTMHDYWIVLKVFAAKGIVLYVPRSLILYRQHQNNTVGAKEQPSNFFSYMIAELLNLNKVIKWNIRIFYQNNAIKHISTWEYIRRKIKYVIRLRSYKE